MELWQWLIVSGVVLWLGSKVWGEITGTTPPPNTGGTTPAPNTGGTTPSPNTGGTTPAPNTGGTTPAPNTGGIRPGDTETPHSGLSAFYHANPPPGGAPQNELDNNSKVLKKWKELPNCEAYKGKDTKGWKVIDDNRLKPGYPTCQIHSNPNMLLDNPLAAAPCSWSVDDGAFGVEAGQECKCPKNTVIQRAFHISGSGENIETTLKFQCKKLNSIASASDSCSGTACPGYPTKPQVNKSRNIYKNLDGIFPSYYPDTLDEDNNPNEIPPEDSPSPGSTPIPECNISSWMVFDGNFMNTTQRKAQNGQLGPGQCQGYSGFDRVLCKDGSGNIDIGPGKSCKCPYGSFLQAEWRWDSPEYPHQKRARCVPGELFPNIDSHLPVCVGGSGGRGSRMDDHAYKWTERNTAFNDSSASGTDHISAPIVGRNYNNDKAYYNAASTCEDVKGTESGGELDGSDGECNSVWAGYFLDKYNPEFYQCEDADRTSPPNQKCQTKKVGGKPVKCIPPAAVVSRQGDYNGTDGDGDIYIGKILKEHETHNKPIQKWGAPWIWPTPYYGSERDRISKCNSHPPPYGKDYNGKAYPTKDGAWSAWYNDCPEQAQAKEMNVFDPKAS